MQLFHSFRWVVITAVALVEITQGAIDSNSHIARFEDEVKLNCSIESDFDLCFQQLLDFVTTEEVPHTDVTDLNIVVGLTRVGKSIITQVLANDSNVLPITCTPAPAAKCSIFDDSGSAGNSVISETFLPNLVVHNSTDGKKTAFYDMPGFNDNRNVTIDIANAYFVRTVLNKAQRIKLIIVGLHSYFSINDTNGFKFLLGSLCQLIPNALTFFKSLAFVPNMVEKGKFQYEDTLHYDYLTYVRDEFDSSIIADCSTFADDFMSILNTSDSSLGFEASLFIRPFQEIDRSHNETNLRDNEDLKRLVDQITSMVWNGTGYVEVTQADFGYPLSPESKTFMDKAAAKFKTDLTQLITTAETTGLAFLKGQFVGLVDSTTDKNQLTNYMNSLNGETFEYSNNQSLSPTDCLGLTLEAVHRFAPGSFSEDDVNKMRPILNFIIFMEDVLQYQIFSCPDWVAPLIDFKQKLFDKVKLERIDSQLIEIAKTTLQVAGVELVGVLKDDVGNSSTPEATCVTMLQNISDSIESIQAAAVTSTTFSELLSNITDDYRSLSNDKILDPVDLISPGLVEMLGIQFEWKSHQWHLPLLETSQTLDATVLRPLKFERFLQTLYNELMVERVQSFDEHNLNLKAWWRAQGTNIALVWTKFHGEGSFAATKVIDTGEYDALMEETANVNKVRELMTIALSPLVCPPPSEEMIFIDNSLSLENVMRCIGTGTRPKSIVLIARHSIYVDANVDGPAINPTDAPLVAFLSPNWVVNGTKQINLQGAKGAQGSSGAGVGDIGKKGGSFFGVYLSSTTAPSLQYNLNGGEGGQGGKGNTGPRGASAGAIDFDADSNDCAAWSGGKIAIRIHPNTCNSCDSESCACHAGNDGVRVTIYGKNGDRGLQGLKGGNAGAGGPGGNRFVISLNQTGSTNSTGTSGLLGFRGDGGDGGEGGENGRDRIVVVDDVTGGNGKKCKQLSGAWGPGKGFASRGPSGPPGDIGRTSMEAASESIAPLEKLPLDIAKYASYSNMFKRELGATVCTHQFLRPICQTALDAVNKHSHIPK